MARYKNSEGYYDSTAGKAMANADQKYRQEEKKRAEKIKQKCIRMRSMTNEQLYNYVENRVAKAKSEGYNMGKKKALNRDELKEKVLTVKGIGETKAEEILKAVYGE